MIVCVCKSVSDRQIRAAIAQGVDSFDELQFELGVATCCGRCEASVRDVMAQCGVCESHGHVEHSGEPAAEVVNTERKAA